MRRYDLAIQSQQQQLQQQQQASKKEQQVRALADHMPYKWRHSRLQASAQSLSQPQPQPQLPKQPPQPQQPQKQQQVLPLADHLPLRCDITIGEDVLPQATRSASWLHPKVGSSGFLAVLCSAVARARFPLTERSAG